MYSKYKIESKNYKISLSLPIIACLLFQIVTVKAQYADSTIKSHPINSFWKSDFTRKTTIPVILLGATALTWPHKEVIREVRNRFIPTFRYHYDDYLQYAPAATVLALNAMNIKGKHTPKRALVSYAFSMGIMGVLVNGIKHTAQVQRPDASSKNSFPSGHTAMSFMNATVLHKEYGDYRHELFSVGGYAVATATALGRGLNNRHWVPDVLAGAAIGIVSTELGYLITDQIFKNRGMNAPLRNYPIPINNKPSFMEIHLGYANAVSKDLSALEGDELYAAQGFNVGLEGAYFLTKHFGVGAELAFTSFPVHSDRVVLDEELLEMSTGLYTQALGVKYLNIGPYFSYPLPNNWFVTAKVNAGLSSGSSGNIILELNEKYEKELGRPEIPYLRYKPQTAVSWSTGIGIQKRIGRNTAIKAYATYFNSTHKFTMDGLEEIDDNGNYIYERIPGNLSRLNFNHVTLGLGLTAFIW